MSYREPRRLSEVLERFVESAAPATTLARLQRAWPDVAGPVIAAETEVVAEREGEVRVACSSSVWAGELGLLAPGLRERLNEALGGPAVASLRFFVRSSRKGP